MKRMFITSLLVPTLPIFGMYQPQKPRMKEASNIVRNVTQEERLVKAAYAGSLVDALLLVDHYTMGSVQTKPDAEKAQTFASHAESLKQQKKSSFIEKERSSRRWSSEQEATAEAERCFALHMAEISRLQKARRAQIYLERNSWYDEITSFLGQPRSFEAPLAAKELTELVLKGSDRAFNLLKIMLSCDKSAAVYLSVLDYLGSCDGNPIYEDLLRLVYIWAHNHEPLRTALMKATLESVKKNLKLFAIFIEYGTALHQECQAQIIQTFPLICHHEDYYKILKFLMRSPVPVLRDAAFAAGLQGIYDEHRVNQFMRDDLEALVALDPKGDYFERFYAEAKDKKNDYAIQQLFCKIAWNKRHQGSVLQKKILYNYLETLGEHSSADIKFATCELPKGIPVKASNLDLARINAIVEAGRKTGFPSIEPHFFAHFEEVLMLNEATPLAYRAQLLNDSMRQQTRNCAIECDGVKKLQLSISSLADSPFKQWAQTLFQALRWNISYYETFLLRQKLTEIHEAHPVLPKFPEVLNRSYIREFNVIPESDEGRPYETIPASFESALFVPGNLIYGYIANNSQMGWGTEREHVRLFACDKISGLPVWASSRQSAGPNMLGLFKDALWEFFKSEQKEENGQIIYNSTFILYNPATGDIKNELVIRTKAKIKKVFFCEPFAVFLTELGLYIMRDEFQPLLVDLQNVSSSRNAVCVGKRIIFPYCGTAEASEIGVYDLESGKWGRIPTGRPTDVKLKPEIFGNQQLLFIALPMQDNKPALLLCHDKEGCVWTFTLPANLKKATLSSDGSLACILTERSMLALETNGPKKRWEFGGSDYIDIQLSDDGTKLYALHLNTKEQFSPDADELHLIDAHSGVEEWRCRIGEMNGFFFAGFFNNKPYCVDKSLRYGRDKSKKKASSNAY